MSIWEDRFERLHETQLFLLCLSRGIKLRLGLAKRGPWICSQLAILYDVTYSLQCMLPSKVRRAIRRQNLDCVRDPLSASVL